MAGAMQAELGGEDRKLAREAEQVPRLLSKKLPLSSECMHGVSDSVRAGSKGRQRGEGPTREILESRERGPMLCLPARVVRKHILFGIPGHDDKSHGGACYTDEDLCLQQGKANLTEKLLSSELERRTGFLLILIHSDSTYARCPRLLWLPS
eukprot:3935819-Rhodomonas_salina.4